MRVQKSSSEKGQAIVLIALGIVGLFAFVALAIDGGMVLYDRRSAQNAADAAALAGAYEIARDPWNISSLTDRIQSAATSRAHENHYGNEDGKTVIVTYPASANIHFAKEDPIITKCTSPADKRCNYVEVQITSTVKTSFLHLISFNSVRNTVTAVAHVIPPRPISPFAGTGLVSLAPTGCGMTYLSGNLVANLVGGGIFVNSDGSISSCNGGGGALDGPGNSSFIFTPSLDIVGDLSTKLSVGTGSGSSIIVDDMSHVTYPNPDAALEYPPGIDYPDPPLWECKDNNGNWVNAHTSGTVVKEILTADGSKQSITFDDWNPGYLAGGFPGGNVYFEPGVYCINVGNGGTSIGSHQFVYNDPDNAERVLLILTGVKPCKFTINGGATVQLKGYAGDANYKGLLFYVDPRDYACWPSSCPDGSMNFNGNQVSYVNGTIFAPTCEVQMNGTGGNMYQGQVIGYTLKLLGGAAINLNYRQEDNWDPPSKSREDLTQ